MSNEKNTYPWEDWQLTAFVLGELEPDEAREIALAAEADPVLKSEVEAIGRTVSQISASYQTDSESGLGDQQLAEILQQSVGAGAIGNAVATKPTSGNSGRGVWRWLAGGALAASLAGGICWMNPGWFASESSYAVSNDLPAVNYLSDDVQYFPADEANRLSSEVDSLPSEEVWRALSQRRQQQLGRSRSSDKAEVSGFDSEAASAGFPVDNSQSMGGEGGMGGYGGGGGMYGGGGGGVRGGTDALYAGLGQSDQPASGQQGVQAVVTVPDGGSIGLGGITRLAKDLSGRIEPIGTKTIHIPVAPRTIVQEGKAGEVALGVPLRNGVTPQKFYGQQTRRPDVGFKLDVSGAGLSDGLRTDAYGVELKRELGQSPGERWMGFVPRSGDQFTAFNENPFEMVAKAPLSTVSIDVDTAAFTKCRQLLLQNRSLPPAGAVRLEEFINYFDYEYTGPEGEHPFSSALAASSCPWQPEHRLVRIALQATKMEVEERPAANIVFLLDVSGSMNSDNKLPLVKDSMRMLAKQLGEGDRVAMVVYAGAAGCVLDPTTGDRQDEILGALDELSAGGSTNGGQGIQLAYNLARDNFVPGGINRVILCTDGDFNVGVTSTDALVDLVAENAKSKIFLTVLGFGMGNTNDAMMEKISNSGDGVYGFVDSRREAHRQMVQQLAGNLITVAKDVKIQVEFNPNQVQAYRLLGYENRVMADRDFNDDTKDAGEIGAGHRVTAMYEVVPVGVETSVSRPSVDPLKYQSAGDAAKDAVSDAVSEVDAEATEFADELLTVKLRYKQPEGTTSQLIEFPLEDQGEAFSDSDRDFQWAASMVQFGMLLRHSQFRGSTTWESLIEQASQAAGISPDASRQECLTMIRMAAELSGQ